MAEERVQRRLAAILAADVVGYSRLMDEDELGTLERLKSLRRELFEPATKRHGGRVFKTTGDGALVEFKSAVDAVNSAVDIQRGLTERDGELPEDRRIRLRIGISLGDVIVEGGDLYGNGVNVAVRMEGLAETGGICISGNVHEHVRGSDGLILEDLGEQEIKNIDRPVRAYKVVLDVSGPVGPMADKAPPIPDKPSIAVLPFANMSGDPEQEYFADGIAEDIITALSRFRWFFVIARNSSFTYKGRNVDIRQIGRELGVRYVLEGSVRKGGDRLRITAQLVEAATGNHLWAEKYDGAIADVFNLQDQITEGVVGAVEPSVRQAEIERARVKRPDNLDAYDLYLRALPHAWNWSTEEATTALKHLDQALRIDPTYTAAHGLAAWCHEIRAQPWLPSYDRAEMEAAVRHARAVLQADTDDALALAYAGFALGMFERDYDRARASVDQALALNPNAALAHSVSAMLLSLIGDLDATIEEAELSLRLNPRDPTRYFTNTILSGAYFLKGCYSDAVTFALRAIQANPRFLPAYLRLAAGYVGLNRMTDAREAAQRVLELEPNLRFGSFPSVANLASAHKKAMVDALHKAGLPE